MKDFKYKMYIGLKEKNMSKNISVKNFNAILNNRFSKIGIKGFNISFINGFWNNKQEKTAIVEFINTFGLSEKVINNTTRELAIDLNQESILIERLQSNYNFIGGI